MEQGNRQTGRSKRMLVDVLKTALECSTGNRIIFVVATNVFHAEFLKSMMLDMIVALKLPIKKSYIHEIVIFENTRIMFRSFNSMEYATACALDLGCDISEIFYDHYVIEKESITRFTEKTKKERNFLTKILNFVNICK